MRIYFIIDIFWLLQFLKHFISKIAPKLCQIPWYVKPNIQTLNGLSTVRVVTTRITLPNRGFLGSLNLFNFTSFSSPTPMGWRSQFIEPFVCRLTHQKSVRNFHLFNSSSSYYVHVKNKNFKLTYIPENRDKTYFKTIGTKNLKSQYKFNIRCFFLWNEMNKCCQFW